MTFWKIVAAVSTVCFSSTCFAGQYRLLVGKCKIESLGRCNSKKLVFLIDEVLNLKFEFYPKIAFKRKILKTQELLVRGSCTYHPKTLPPVTNKQLDVLKKSGKICRPKVGIQIFRKKRMILKLDFPSPKHSDDPVILSDLSTDPVQSLEILISRLPNSK